MITLLATITPRPRQWSVPNAFCRDRSTICHGELPRNFIFGFFLEAKFNPRWVNEDGSLKMSATNRTGQNAGFMDLSLHFHSEDFLFKHVVEMTTNSSRDVTLSFNLKKDGNLTNVF